MLGSVLAKILFAQKKTFLRERISFRENHYLLKTCLLARGNWALSRACRGPAQGPLQTILAAGPGNAWKAWEYDNCLIPLAGNYYFTEIGIKEYMQISCDPG